MDTPISPVVLDEGEQRARIAEACGWKRSPLENWPWQMVPPGGDGTTVKNCPDYPHDLNAMHEAEKFLSDVQIIDYQGLLSMICSTHYVRATAPERAQAFLEAIDQWPVKRGRSSTPS